MALPKVLYIARSDMGGGAEQRLNLTAQHYPGTLAVYVKYNHHTWNKVKTLPVAFIDRIFAPFNHIYYKITKGIRVNLRSRLFLTETCNQTWKHIKNLPEFWACDIVHISNLHTNYFDLSALEKIAQHKPIVLNVSDLWMITGGEAHSPGDDGFKSGIATTNDISLYPLSSPWIDRRQQMMEKKQKIFSRWKDRIFYMTNSDWTEQQFLSSWVMRFGPDYRTIKPGIDINLYINHKKRAWLKLRVLCFYSDSKFKNPALIQTALSQVTQTIELYVIGNPISLPNQNIQTHYVGKYLSSPELLSQQFNNVDVLLYPSIAETFGMMVAEAKSCGVCVIGTNGTAVEEQIQHRQTGLLINQNDAQQLASEIDWCAKNITAVREIGNNAAEDIRLNYTFERYMKETESYYQYIKQKTVLQTISK